MKRLILIALACVVAVIAGGAAALGASFTYHQIHPKHRKATHKRHPKPHPKPKPPPTTSTSTTTPTTTTTITTTTSTTSTTTTTPTSGFTSPPQNSTSGHWYWQIGGGTLPSMTGSGAPATANIWDTDYFNDANVMGANNEASGLSTIVTSEKSSGKYAICYIEAGAAQTGFPDEAQFAKADYTNPNGTSTQMQGYSSENWFDTLGFAGWTQSSPSRFPGGSAADQTAAVNIAAGITNRIAGCATEGQQAIEPDDLDGYTNTAQGGGKGGGWGLTQTAAAGYEQWLAFTAHGHGLAAFQKNDLDNVSADVAAFDGIIDEQCNQYSECSTLSPYHAAGKPVLNAEYGGGSGFCMADNAAGIAGSLFNVNLSGGTYTPCRTS